MYMYTFLSLLVYNFVQGKVLNAFYWVDIFNVMPCDIYSECVAIIVF